MDTFSLRMVSGQFVLDSSVDTTTLINVMREWKEKHPGEYHELSLHEEKSRKRGERKLIQVRYSLPADASLNDARNIWQGGIIKQLNDVFGPRFRAWSTGSLLCAIV